MQNFFLLHLIFKQTRMILRKKKILPLLSARDDTAPAWPHRRMPPPPHRMPCLPRESNRLHSATPMTLTGGGTLSDSGLFGVRELLDCGNDLLSGGATCRPARLQALVLAHVEATEANNNEEERRGTSATPRLGQAFRDRGVR